MLRLFSRLLQHHDHTARASKLLAEHAHLRSGGNGFVVVSSPLDANVPPFEVAADAAIVASPSDGLVVAKMNSMSRSSLPRFLDWTRSQPSSRRAAVIASTQKCAVGLTSDVIHCVAELEAAETGLPIALARSILVNAQREQMVPPPTPAPPSSPHCVVDRVPRAFPCAFVLRAFLKFLQSSHSLGLPLCFPSFTAVVDRTPGHGALAVLLLIDRLVNSAAFAPFKNSVVVAAAAVDLAPIEKGDSLTLRERSVVCFPHSDPINNVLCEKLFHLSTSLAGRRPWFDADAPRIIDSWVGVEELWLPESSVIDVVHAFARAPPFVGHSLDPATQVGPMADGTTLDRFIGAVLRGAQKRYWDIAFGGSRFVSLSCEGPFAVPSVVVLPVCDGEILVRELRQLANLDSVVTAAAADKRREEIWAAARFGPLLKLRPFRTTHAMQLAREALAGVRW